MFQATPPTAVRTSQTGFGRLGERERSGIEVSVGEAAGMALLT
jgi:hypothetical protein